MENHGIKIKRSRKLLIWPQLFYSNVRNDCELLQLWKWVCSAQKQGWLVEDAGEGGVRKTGPFKGVDFSLSQKRIKKQEEKEGPYVYNWGTKLQFKQSLFSASPLKTWSMALFGQQGRTRSEWSPGSLLLDRGVRDGGLGMLGMKGGSLRLSEVGWIS